MSTSSFPDVESAQKYTQYCIRHNTAEIQDWLKNPPPSPPFENVPGVVGTAGRPASRKRGNGPPRRRRARLTQAPSTMPHGVSTRVKYDPNLNPPFVVLTSMPE
ncbi:RNase A-like domain-containing protein [Streptomyces sp. NPDC056257]|uniref:RNase A-like domain-containing protein n=1 Tax=Streptomyces sp. NPDC056257 TaxID=3345765 RepID=UPI0035D82D5C